MDTCNRWYRISPLFLALIAGCREAAGPGASSFGHVVLVIEENHNYSNVIGAGTMPFLDSLAQQNALATQYYANTHPSIGNYFMLVVGDTVTNNDSYTGTITADNLIRRLVAAGKTWKSYAEGLPSAGYTGKGVVGRYASRHNPVVYLSDVVNDPQQAANVVPFASFATDIANGNLPQFSLVIPDLCNDAHDCTLGVADGWLEANLAALLNSAVFKQDGLLIVTFDEAASSDVTNGGGRIAWVAVGARVKKSFQSATLYQHQSTLRLIAQGLGVTTYPGLAGSAPDMMEFFAAP